MEDIGSRLFGDFVEILKCGCRKHIVIVAEGDVFAVRISQADIAWDRRTAGIFITLDEVDQMSAFGRIDYILDDFDRVVGRAVVDHDHLEVLERLIEHAFETLSDIFFRVVERNDY